jgi:hypothetical protein
MAYEFGKRLDTLLVMAHLFNNHLPITLAVHHEVHAVPQGARRVNPAQGALLQEQGVGVLIDLRFQVVVQLSQGASNAACEVRRVAIGGKLALWVSHG